MDIIFDFRNSYCLGYRSVISYVSGQRNNKVVATRLRRRTLFKFRCWFHFLDIRKPYKKPIIKNLSYSKRISSLIQYNLFDYV